MTYDEEPTRWTASPEQAPELLRGAFAAGRNEGPSKTQMRALALKIAALSAGGAVAIGTVKAAAGSQVAASAATWSLGKLAGVLILVGGIATGAVIWNRSPEPSLRGAHPAPQALLPPIEESAAQVTPAQQERTQPEPVAQVEPAADVVEPVVTRLSPPSAEQPAVAANELTTGSASATRTAPARTAAARRQAVSARARRSVKAAAPPAPRRAEPAGADSGARVGATEIELLRQAQLALRARPREAFQLTEEHRRLHPDGEFALERDALAIQALIRAGNPTMARDLAESFLRTHPESPHAHRFREAMGIH